MSETKVQSAGKVYAAGAARGGPEWADGGSCCSFYFSAKPEMAQNESTLREADSGFFMYAVGSPNRIAERRQTNINRAA
jgi:hypothetical protein